MPARSLIAIGASAGGVESLRRFVSVLPVGLDAAVAVVLHLAPKGPSVLASILTRAGVLAAAEARDGEDVEPGRIYTAGPDRHLFVEHGQFRVVAGPRVHGLRPAVDPLFHSVANEFGPRAIGVILSGTLADGTEGLAAVKAHGGWAMVEDPQQASHRGMPSSAVEHVDVDLVGSCEDLGQTAVSLVETWQADDSRTVG
jgi:two-component system chemotaxis response regulator CheB